jgi:hypothetical protein
MPFVGKWMEMDILILSEINQTETYSSYSFLYVRS